MIRKALPGNSNLATAQAAQTPKATLNGTATAAVITPAAVSVPANS